MRMLDTGCAGLVTGLALSDLAPFRELPSGALVDVLTDAGLRRVAPGTTVFVQGTAAARFFLLVEGRLKIEQVTRDGRQIIAHLVAPGEFFGMAICQGRDDYPGTATTLMASTILSWPREAWPRMMIRHPALASCALRTIAGHLQDVVARLLDVTAVRAEQRIARTILRLALEAGTPTADGLEIGFPLTRREIAEMTTTTLHTVSRTLSAWKQAGILADHGRRIAVLDLAALDELAKGD